MTKSDQIPVAIVTGAGRGVGRATAIELDRRGYRLVLVARTRAELEQTAALLGREPMIEAADVAERDAAGHIVKRADERFGRVDALVNNAGHAPLLSIETVTEEQWRRVIEVNLSGALWFSQAVWPVFRRQESGVIVNISSLSSRDPFPGLEYYGAAKAGLNLLGMALAREGRPVGVKSYTLALGAVETRMLRSLFDRTQSPPEATLSPAEVAAEIGKCVAGESGYTSGQTVVLKKL